MTFDPNAHIIQLRGKGGTADYLPVAARIAWFRDKHPDGHIAIEAHAITDQIAVFHARVSIPDGGSAEGWGSETPRDFGDFIEKASTKALGRALLALGFGTMQAGEELDEGGRIADAPVERPRPARNAPTRAERPQDARNEPGEGATPTLTPREFDRVIEGCWTLVEDGAVLDAVKASLNHARPRMSEEQRIVARQQLTAIETAIAERDALTPAG